MGSGSRSSDAEPLTTRLRLLSLPVPAYMPAYPLSGALGRTGRPPVKRVAGCSCELSNGGCPVSLGRRLRYRHPRGIPETFHILRYDPVPGCAKSAQTLQGKLLIFLYAHVKKKTSVYIGIIAVFSTSVKLFWHVFCLSNVTVGLTREFSLRSVHVRYYSLVIV